MNKIDTLMVGFLLGVAFTITIVIITVAMQ
jgi:hypothetical protein